MKKALALGLTTVLWPVLAAGADILRPYGPVSPVEVFRKLNGLLLDAWPDEGRAFMEFITSFNVYYLYLALGLLGVFLLHYFVFGPRKIVHRGEKVPYYGFFTRFVHWGAAVSMTLLVLSGLAVLFAKALGGGSLVMGLRSVHVGAAFIFVIFAVFLFLALVKDMFPAPYDLKWFLVLGGYLSRRTRPVPAGKFNAGQKLWFWVGTAGGLVMFYTGYKLYQFTAPVSYLREVLKIHLYLGLAVLGLFLIHLYMSVIAVKGALQSMLTGYKDIEEVAVMHPKFYEKLRLKG
ncbi:MAG: formate dehydrogenase subunit gamma [Thermodesulfobacteria bacterium]|nr:formate dehydrogenase subunit gamma [Thermodesulfobacteriota bacterium]